MNIPIRPSRCCKVDRYVLSNTRIHWALVLACSACAGADSVELGEQASAIVYGQDDRAELYVTDGDLVLAPVARAVAAIIPSANLSADGSLVTPTLGEQEHLCPGVAYADQPAAAACTAALIDDTLLATAGHCIRTDEACREHRFVFSFAYAAPGRLADLEVYTCRRVRVQAEDRLSDGTVRDYAILELDERVRERAPLALRTQPLAAGQTVVSIGTQGGVPSKIDRAGRVLDPRLAQRDYFTLSADAFHGGSGGPVVDDAGQLAGWLARGHGDYVWDRAAGCNRLAELPDADAMGGEQASYAQLAVDALCADPGASVRLCGQPVPGCSVSALGHRKTHALWVWALVWLTLSRRGARWSTYLRRAARRPRSPCQLRTNDNALRPP